MKRIDTTKLPPGFRQLTLLAIHEVVYEKLPHFYTWLTDQDDFEGLNIKRREDGTCIAVAKGYDPEGLPVVAFGSGYDALSCLVQLDRAINGGKWREDKPWQPNGQGK